MSRNDLPNEKASNFQARLRETVQTMLGTRGDKLDRVVTLRDLIESGITKLAPGWRPGGSGAVPLLPGDGLPDPEVYEPDLTPPPTPDGFAVDAAISNFFVQHADPVYPQGHGHLRTRVYGATVEAGAPLPTFNDAVEIDQFTGVFRAIPSNPSTTWHLWIKWESVDGVLSASPAGGVNGLSVTTGQNVEALLEALTGQITASELASSLSTPIASIPTLAAGTSANTASISAIQSELATIANTPDYAAGTAYTLDEIVKYNGGLYRALGATTGNLPTNTTYWQKIGDYASLGGAVAAHAVELDDHETRIVAAEGGLVAEATARNLLASTVNNNTAAIQTEATTRATEDTALGNRIDVVKAVVDNPTTGVLATSTALDAVKATVNNGTTGVVASANRLNALEATVNTGPDSNTALRGSVTNEATVRAAADTALSNTISTVQASLTTTTGVANSALANAAAAQTTANTANTAAGTANTLLADIASDAKLTPSEKQVVRAEWSVIAAEKAGINTQAAAFAVTTENTAYNTAFQALATYLNNGAAWSSGIPNWVTDANLSVTTTIVGATFRTNFANYYAARTALLNAIALKAKQLADAAQATANLKADATVVTAINTRVGTVEGQIVSQAGQITTVQSQVANIGGVFTENWYGPDPVSRWQSYQGAGELAVVSVTDGVGGKALQVGNNAGNDMRWLVHRDLIPFDPSKLYRMQVRLRRSLGSGVVYIGWVGVSANGTTLVSTAGGNFEYNAHYHAAANAGPGTSWSTYTGYTHGHGASAGTSVVGTLESPGKMHPNVRYLRAMVLVNYSSASGVTEVGPLVVEDVTATEALSASIQTESSTRAAETGELYAKYTVKIDTNGYVSGFGLASTANNATPFSEFAVRADRFYIASPSGPGVAPSMPFIVRTTATTIGGVSVPVGVYMSDAFIQNGSMTNAKIANLAVDDAKVVNLSASKLTAGSIAVGESIQSTGYIPNETGWRIDGNGNAEFVNGRFIGEVIAQGPSGQKARMWSGDFEIYKNVPGVGQVLYKAVSRVEGGVGSNNVQVTILGYFVNQPRVIVSPADIKLYDAAFAGQSQSLQCEARFLQETSSGSMVWRFTPVATLSLAANTGTAVINQSSGSISSNWTSSQYTTQANTASITPSVSLSSVRGTGTAGNYHLRSARWRVEYLSGGSWISGAFTTVNLSASANNTATSSAAFSFPSAGAWTFRIYCEAFDTGGTFTTGTEYETATDSISRSGNVVAEVAYFSAGTVALNYTPTYTLPSGWTLVSVAYSYVYSYAITLDSGTGAPGASISGSGLFFNGAGSGNNLSNAHSRASNSLTFSVTAGYDSFWQKGSSARLTLHSTTGTVTRQRPLTNSTTASNSFALNSYSYNLTSAQVLATGTLNWMAIGE